MINILGNFQCQLKPKADWWQVPNHPGFMDASNSKLAFKAGVASEKYWAEMADKRTGANVWISEFYD